MAVESQLQDISHTIQLAVAPVFLLTAIATTLNVLTTRLGRIVDRARRVEGRLHAAATEEEVPVTARELTRLARRARLIQIAITFGVGSALLVCLTIATAFVGYMLDARLGGAMAVLFLLAVAAYVGALACFLREIFWAYQTLTFNLPPEAPEDPAPRA
ncbi:MAG: DUF2721 domain-containing protein [Anaeromyxobacteraceae bacterium]